MNADDREWGRFEPASAERAALETLTDLTHSRIRPRVLRMADGGRVEVDGGDEAGSVVVQLPLRRGEFTSAYRNKVMADMFKLGWLRQVAVPGARAILCVSPAAAAAFSTASWLTRAARDAAIEIFSWDGQRLERR